MLKLSRKWRYHSNIIIVNFVKDVSEDFLSTKIHIGNNCCQISCFLSENKVAVGVGWGFGPADPTGRAYSAPLDSIAG